ncbi:MAG: N-acetylmuramoyl-L-alanine amidase family protein [Flavobacteriaceae bacterium]
MSKNIRFRLIGFYCLLFFSAFSLVLGQTTEKKFVVVLDAGHGGKDTGNRGNGYYEKHIALNITLAIGESLKKHEDIKVIYTRTSDRFIELNNRAKIANEADADLFISIHCDAFTSSRAFGAGTFVLGLHRNQDNFRIAQKENSVIFLEEDYESTYDGFDPNNPESVISLVLMQETYLDKSIEAASTIQKSFVENLNRKDRTVKQAGFLVLRETYMPSVLVEVGFLTNAKEGAYLNSKKGQREMASTISQAILNYKKLLNASISTIAITKTNLTDKVLNPDTLKTPSHRKLREITFKVQIAAGSKILPLKNENFKGLNALSRENDGRIYRYFYGNASSYNQAKKLKKKAIKKGYKHAFLVAFRNGEKIPISEAISKE